MILLSVISLFLVSGVLARPSTSCRCLYGQDCWPSADEFSHLASQLSLPLIYPVPPEAACYPSMNTSGNCSEVLENTIDAKWRADQAGSMDATNFETFTFDNGTISACYLNTTLGIPCERGNVPIIGVDARVTSDIQAAVKFATKHNLRLVVKNTGHDFLGRSSARGSFLVWTHHHKDITYNASFVPKGAPASETYNAITLGAGVQWYEAYDAIQAQNRMLVGGMSATVGAAGGWLLGGGHSALSPLHGLGVDNVVQLTLVTSTGDLLTVNSHSHPDLFWAVRGGGGGTYGIVTSATYRTHPSIPLISVYLAANSTNPDTMKKLITECARIHPSLSDAGWAGYTTFAPGSLTFIYMAPNISWEQANATIDPFFAFAQNLTSEGLELTFSTNPVDSFYSWFTDIFSYTQTAGNNLEIGSRLLPREIMENQYEQFAQSVIESGEGSWHLIAGGAVAKVDPESTGLNPAWRKALIQVTFGSTWEDGTPLSTIEELRTKIKESIMQFEALAPGSGAYFNEASLYEEDPQHTFFGSHYGKLKTIKDIYDPHHLFVVAEGVGSDEWDSTLNCRR